MLEKQGGTLVPEAWCHLCEAPWDLHEPSTDQEGYLLWCPAPSKHDDDGPDFHLLGRTHHAFEVDLRRLCGHQQADTILAARQHRLGRRTVGRERLEAAHIAAGYLHALRDSARHTLLYGAAGMPFCTACPPGWPATCCEGPYLHAAVKHRYTNRRLREPSDFAVLGGVAAAYRLSNQHELSVRTACEVCGRQGDDHRAIWNEVRRNAAGSQILAGRAAR